MVKHDWRTTTPFAGHPAQVLTIALTSDDTRIITTSDDCTIRIWELASGDPVGQPLTGHADWIRAAAVTSDDTRVIAGDDTGTVRIWELVIGEPIGDPLTGNTGRVRALAVTSDSTQIVTAGDDSDIRILDLTSGELVGDPLTGHTGRVFAVALTSDDAQIITAGEDGTVRIWDRKRRRVAGLVRTGPVSTLALAPDDARIVTGGADGAVRIWDRASGEQIGAPLAGHAGAVLAVAISADSTQIVTGGADGTVRVWNRASGEQMGDPLAGHTLWVRALAVTADGSRIITGGADGTVRIWERATGRQIGDAIFGHTARVLAIAITSDGSQIITGSGDGGVRIWELATGRQIGDPLTGRTGRVFAVALSSDDAHIISAGDDGAVRTWDRLTGHPVGAELIGHTGRVLALALTSDDSQLITAGVDGTIRIWDRAEGRQVNEWSAGHRGQVSALALTSDDSRIVSAGEDGAIRIWDLAGRQIGEPLTGHTGIVFALAVMADDSRIVSTSDDGTIRIWELASGRQIGEPLTGHLRRVRALALTSDDTRIITGGEDGTIRIWDPASGRQVAGTESALAATIASDPHSGVVSDAESAIDQLGMTRDVDSLAALLAARDTAPPLSVALLGNWGSGKSSFMQQVINRVDSLATASRRNPQASAYAAEVLQVRFNAWHYSDDHLWVGLVEHLFRELAGRRDAKDDGGQRAAMEAKLASEEARRDQLAEDLTAVDRSGHDDHWFGWLTKLSRVLLVLRVASRSVWAEIGRPRRVFAGLLLIVALCLIVLLSVQGQAILGWVTGIVAGIIALLSPVAQVWQQVNAIIDKVRGKLQEQKDATERNIEQLTGQLDRIDPARRLQNLLQQISSPERYAEYRGIVGRIRQDLERISIELGAAQDDWVRAGSGNVPPLQRIILYVDDLDRCTAARVVQVLQAVNLLLGMPLFIVVVAVDPRWLQTALEDQYRAELGTDERRQRSLDFLDKVFHVAYAVRPMGDRAVGYLRDLLSPVADDTSVQEGGQRHPPPGEGTGSAPIASTTETPSIMPPEVAEGSPGTSVAQEPPVVRRRPSNIDLTHRALRLSPAEYHFLPYLAPLLTTPRAVKKLNNLYRLLRIAIPEDQREEFLGNDQGGPYQAAALLLAAVISYPAQAGSLLTKLIAIEPGSDIVDTLTNFDDCALAINFAKRIREIREEIPVPGDVTIYQKWAVSVARYNFETYQLFSA